MSFTDAPDFIPNADKEKDGAIPRFYVETTENKAKSAKEGRPIFEDVEMVEILIPGDRLNTVHQRVAQKHKDRWPRFYQAFKNNQDAPLDGTPLEQLPGMTKSRVEELKYFHIKTVESLAGMPDDLLMKAASMDGRALRDKAQRWLQAVAGEAVSEKLAAENRALSDKMADMERQLADLKGIADGLQAQLARAGSPPAVEG